MDIKHEFHRFHGIKRQLVLFGDADFQGYNDVDLFFNLKQSADVSKQSWPKCTLLVL